MKRALALALALIAAAGCAVRHSIDVGRKAPDCNCTDQKK